jgi:hypothetical protein
MLGSVWYYDRHISREKMACCLYGGTVYLGCRTWVESWSDHQPFWLTFSLPHCPSKLCQSTFQWATLELCPSRSLTYLTFTITFSTLSPNSFYISGTEILTLTRLDISPVLPSSILEQLWEYLRNKITLEIQLTENTIISTLLLFLTYLWSL